MSQSASEILADRFSIIPYPFVGKDRDSVVAEFNLLLESGVKRKEIANMMLDVIEVLLVGLRGTKDETRQNQYTTELADVFGKLQIFEETFKRQKIKI
jgi:hypothetical protein